MKKIIIAGAGGFVGCNLTNKLIEKGYYVIALSNKFNENFPVHHNAVQITTEIDSYDNLINIIPDGDYDAFYNLAWRGVNGSEKADPIIQLDNIQMAINCAKVAKAMNCKKYLCAGTIAERGTDSIPSLKNTSGGMAYAVAKNCAHQMLEFYCKNIDLDFVWMQFSNIYGPSNKTGNLVSYTLEQIKKNEMATFGPAQQPYDFIFIDDLIEAVVRLGTMKTSCNFYFIGSGTPRILLDYLKTIGEICNHPELIKIGERPDDGIKYTFDMFDISKLLNDIGEYVSGKFEEHIRFTVDNY